MASINLEQSYKTVCKYCGMVKKSLVPGNFVCGACKKFCEQQLSGEELVRRDLEVLSIIQNSKHFNHRTDWCTQDTFIAKIFKKIAYRTGHVSNQQYLSVKRIVKKENK